MTRGKTNGIIYVDPKLYIIHWMDAVTETGWELGIGNSNLDAVQSVGYLLYQDKEKIILGSDLSYSQDKVLYTNRRISIPKKWIVSMETIGGSDAE